MKKRCRLIGVLSFFLTNLLLWNAASAAIKQPLRIESGLLQGIPGRADGIQVFMGIPYAAAPTGDLRWRAPESASSWTGILKADNFAPDCPTVTALPESKAGSQSEDCLYLNVWTPARTAKDKLAVMVWIYGGAYTNGSTSYPRYDGEGLASKGVIVVSMAYRVGVLGFMTHPLLSAESPHHVSGNYGLLDNVAAIRWVKRNIAAFGGDPKRITIFGQSAGSQSVNLLTASPLAKGLFQRVIGESGAGFGMRQAKLLAQSEQDGVTFADRLGATMVAELRAMTPDELFKAKPPGFDPVVDGWVLPADVHAIYTASQQNDVPTLVGSNSDESQLSTTITLQSYQARALERFGTRAEEFLKLFPATNDDEAGLAAKASDTVLFGNYNVGTWANLQAHTGKAKVYQYRFQHTPPKSQDINVIVRSGSYHGAEIIYAFNNLLMEQREWSHLDHVIAEKLSSYWVNFARNGNPNGPGLTYWPSIQEDQFEVMGIGENIELVPKPDRLAIDFFENVFYSPGGQYRPVR